MSHVERETPSHNQLSIRLHAARGHSSPCFGGPTQFRHIITVVHSMHCTVFVCVCVVYLRIFIFSVIWWRRSLLQRLWCVQWCGAYACKCDLCSHLALVFSYVFLSLSFLFVRVFSMHLKYVIHILLCHSISSYWKYFSLFNFIFIILSASCAISIF